MKADGIEYDERMALLDQVTWPQPLAELLEATYELYRQSHPWLHRGRAGAQVDRPRDVRAGDELHRLRRPLPAGPVRGPGAALPHRRLPDDPPDGARVAPHAGARGPVEWLGETIRQTDSSLLDEWEALTDPERTSPASRRAEPRTRPRSPRPISKQDRAFRVMIRNAMWRRVELVARDDLDGLMALERAAADRTDPPRRGRDDPVAAGTRRSRRYYARARPRRPRRGRPRAGPARRWTEPRRAGRWRVRQTLHDPEGHHDWVIDAVVDLDASDEAGELVLATERCGGCDRAA